MIEIWRNTIKTTVYTVLVPSVHINLMPSDYNKRLTKQYQKEKTGQLHHFNQSQNKNHTTRNTHHYNVRSKNKRQLNNMEDVDTATTELTRDIATTAIRILLPNSKKQKRL
uniref:Ovule protein n=1 Tax=Heterorhabditis bacteriophora TaxID=37862 RepID=A0A1I7WZV7_HETBA